MCGRYLLRNAPPDTSHSPWREYWRDIQLDLPRFNIKPSQHAWVVIAEQGTGVLKATQMNWGFQPKWAKRAYINSKAETLFQLPSFKQAARTSPCLIAADGFYEPKGPAGGYRPWFGFRFNDDRPFFFAGIYHQQQQGPTLSQSFSIITKAAVDSVAPIHERMPVLWDETQSSLWQHWLDISLSVHQRQSILQQPIQYQALSHHPVSDLAKSTKAEEPACFAPLSSEPANNKN